MNGRVTRVVLIAAVTAVLGASGAAAGPLSFLPIPFPGLAGGKSIVVGDFDANGRADLAAVTASGLQTFAGNGDGTFQPPVSLAAGSTPDAVATLRLDNGHESIIVANFADNTVSFFAGNGDGTFQAPHTLATGAGPNGFAVADFDGDGHQDFAVANFFDNTVTIYLGDGTGNFAAAPALATSSGPANAMAVGDFNGDGKLDLAVAAQSVNVFKGIGNGKFQLAVSYAGGADGMGGVFGVVLESVVSLVVATVNGISFLQNLGDGTFASPLFLDVGLAVSGLFVVDLNFDGLDDIVAAEGTGLAYLLRLGDGSLQPRVAIGPALPRGYAALATGDFNNDGRADVAAVSFDAREGPGIILLQVPEADGLTLVALSLVVLLCVRRTAQADWRRSQGKSGQECHSPLGRA
jgi:hypothetical protein